jgi:SAM-dependent methyltransferase
MDTALQDLVLVQRRGRENGINNLTVIAGGDTKYLPFPTGFFDLICVNGVLEQVPLMVQGGLNDAIALRRGLKTSAGSWPASGPLDVQVNFLNEIHRMLKTNGTLYLAADNRFNYRNFLTPPDKRVNLTTSSRLPRLLANLSSLLAGEGPYHNYSLSYPALRKILKRCGFEHIDFYSLKPDHRLFQEILFFDKKNSRQTNRGSLKDRVKNRLFNSKYACPCFGIVAGKNGRTDTFIQTLLNRVAGEFGKKYDVNRYHAMMKGNVVLDLVEKNDPASGFIVKIAVDDAAESQNRKNYDMLSSLHNESAISGEINRLIPRPRGRHTINGQTIYLEDKMRGMQASRAGTDERIKDRILNNALDFIVSLHKATLVQAVWGETEYTQFIGNVIERVRRVGESGQDAFTKIDTMLRSRFIGSGLSLAHKHGDFSVANILIDPRNYTIEGIIDWDNAEQKRPVLIDLVNVIESSYNNFKDLELGRTVTDILLKNNLSYSEKALVRKYGSVFGCPEDSLVPYTLLYWLYHFDSQIKYNYLIHNPRWMRDNYYNVLAEVQKIL